MKDKQLNKTKVLLIKAVCPEKTWVFLFSNKNFYNITLKEVKWACMTIWCHNLSFNFPSTSGSFIGASDNLHYGVSYPQNTTTCPKQAMGRSKWVVFMAVQMVIPCGYHCSHSLKPVGENLATITCKCNFWQSCQASIVFPSPSHWKCFKLCNTVELFNKFKYFKRFLPCLKLSL